MATDYAPDKIRNVILLGHSHDGKTMLAEAMLFASGAVARMGSPDQSTATMDFEPEEQKRKISINLGVGFAEHNGYKINILDAPGFFDFAGQILSGLRAAEGAVVDRKSTRLNSSHRCISYAVFCLKKETRQDR